MKKLKQKLLNHIYKLNQRFFRKRVLDSILKQDLENIKKVNLESLYNQNKEIFEGFLIREFTGYVPRDVYEPTLKIFKDNSEMIQRWVLWQSYYINRRSIHDPQNLKRYEGMMIYLKGLHTLADKSKKAEMPALKSVAPKSEKPWLEEALEGLKEFNEKKSGKEDEKIDEEKLSTPKSPSA